MPYQFGDEGVEVISLSDSSEDEDDIVTPTRRPVHNSALDSTATAISLDESETSADSVSDESDDHVAQERHGRPRLQSRVALKLQREIDELDNQPTEFESASDSGSDVADFAEAPQGKVRRREAFQKMLGSMESTDDIELLYPKSLHPDFHYAEEVSDEYRVLMDFISVNVAADEDDDTFEELEMHDFSVYRGILHEKGFNGQFESPHVVCSEQDSGIFYLDGVVHHDDFRMHITIHASFLRDQAWSISGQKDFESDILCHPVWSAVGAGKFTEDLQSNSHHERTVVTPNVGAAFTQSFPKWGPDQYDLLSSVPISAEVATYRSSRRLDFGLPDKFSAQSAEHVVPDVAILLETAATVNKAISRKAADLVGKVVVIRPSATHSGSRDRSYEEQFRFAFVHEVAKSSKAVRVIYLSLPNGTICGTNYDRSYYPIKNELFFNDQCNCRVPVPLSRIVGVHDASVFPTHRDTANNIILQLLYRENDAAFLTPKHADLLCTCEGKRNDVVDSRPRSAAATSNDELPKIRNMSLFSGCGMLDHGLMEAGTFETVFAIDHNEMAVLSLAANSTSQRCTHVVGSVNPYLQQFLTGEASMPEIDCITAGCPCQGISILNVHKGNQRSQRNCSLLASVLSWTELFLPALLLVENVPEMDRVPADGDLSNACAQAICCLVAMGYQVRKIMLTAFEHGSPTLRRRLFIIASAPSVPLPDTPKATHGGIGLQPIVTIRDVLTGLDRIHSDTVINIRDPTHTPIQRLKPQMEWRVSLRNIVKRIPKIPGDGLYQAHQKGLLSKDQNRWYYAQTDEKKEPRSKSLRRVDANIPVKTIVTVISPPDARFGGEIVHPYEDRLLSEKEIRRGQGMPDSFLLIGTLKQRLEQVGNGVAWQVGAALGEVFGNAWRRFHESKGDLQVDDDKTRHTQQILQLPQKMKAQFTETTQAVDDGQSVRSLGGLPIEGIDLQGRLRSMSLEEETADDLPSGDTVVVRTPAAESPSPKLKATPDMGAKASSGLPHQRTKVTISVPVQKRGDTLKVENAFPALGRRSLSRNTSQSEEVYEISDHESLVITPGGTFNYNRSQGGKITRRSSSAKRTEKLTPMVIIPVTKKRAALPTPPPPTTQADAPQSTAKYESDSDIEFLETRPVMKKPRASARVEDWYSD